jgi:Domain of unknown function (DUF4149)
VIGFLRCIGLLNAAIWFGAGVFFMLGVSAAVSSGDMQQLLESYYPSYSLRIAEILIARYYTLAIVCGIIAIIHLLAEQLYFGRAPQKRWISLLVGMLAFILLAQFGLQPKLNHLRVNRFAVNAPTQVRATATESFNTWHRISVAGNFLVLVGLGFYLIRVGAPRESTRFIGSGKFHS